MSLLHWWPLNGTLRDQGLNPVDGTIVGTASVTTTNGIIGKCLSAGDGTQITAGINVATNLLDELNGKDYSFAVWMKANGNHVHYNGTFISSGNWNSQCWAFGVNQNNTKIDVACNGFNKYINYTFTTGQWYHIVSIQQGSTNTVYVNGTLVGSTSQTAIYQSSATNLTIGRETYASGYFSFNGNLADMRIYDHALSLTEIKELSKGCILYYNFEDPYIESTTNLLTAADLSWLGLTCNMSASRSGEKWTLTISSLKGSYTYAISRMNMPLSILTTGTQYCFSFKYRVVSGNGTIKYNSCDWSDMAFVSIEEDHSNDYYYVKMKCPTGRTYSSTYRFMDWYWTDINTVIEMWDIQLEANDHCTPYTLGTRAADYCYDNSGNHYDGTVTNCAIVADEGKGSCCGVFNGSSSRVDVESPTSEIQTLSVWVKDDSISANQVIAADYKSNICVSFYSSGTRLIVATRSYKTVYVLSNYNTSGWNNIVVVKDVGCYINGVAMTATTATNYYTTTADKFIVGCRNNGSYNTYYSGKIAEVKAYATALSATDILTDYQRKAMILRNGSTVSSVFIESGNQNILTLDAVEQGGITDAAGTDANNMNNRLRSKYIPTVADRTYYYKIATNYVFRGVHYYRANKSWISYTAYNRNSGAFTTPTDCAFFRVVYQHSNGSTTVLVADINTFNPTLVIADDNSSALPVNETGHLEIKRSAEVESHLFAEIGTTAKDYRSNIYVTNEIIEN